MLHASCEPNEVRNPSWVRIDAKCEENGRAYILEDGDYGIDLSKPPNAVAWGLVEGTDVWETRVVAMSVDDLGLTVSNCGLGLSRVSVWVMIP